MRLFFLSLNLLCCSHFSRIISLLFCFYTINSYAQWDSVANANFGRWEAPAIAVGDKMYVFGGVTTGFGLSNHVEVYDVNDKSWEDLGTMPQFVSHQGFALVGSEIWMAGGRTDGFQDTDLVQIYSTTTNTWRSGPNLPGKRAGGGMVYLNGLLYFVSGMAVTNGFPGNCPNEASFNDLFVLNPSKPEEGWQTLAPTLNSLNHFGMATAHNRIYMFGGQEGHDCVGIDGENSGNGPDVSSVFEYDPLTNSWEEKASLPFNRSHIEPSTFSYNGQLYVLGGEGPALDQLIFDPFDNDWEFSTQLPQGLMAAAAKVFDDVLILAMGASGSGVNLVGESITYELPLTSEINNDAPRVEEIANQIAEVSDGISLTVSAFDPDNGDVLNFQASGLPEGLSINNSTGEISGIITASPGDYRVIVTVSDNDSESPDTRQAFNYKILTSSTLPVEFASFDITKKGNQVRIQWATSLEESLSYFEIERSYLGNNFSALGRLQPNGSSYEFTDEITQSGTWYYRIKGVDIDGSVSYSDTRSINFIEVGMSVYPNPGKSDFVIEIESFSDRRTQLSLIDIRGRSLWTSDIIVDKGIQQIKPDWETINPGIYTLIMESVGELLPIRVVVQ